MGLPFDRPLSGHWLPLHFVARHMGGAKGLEASLRLLLKEYPKAAPEKDSTEKCPSISSAAATRMARLRWCRRYPNAIKDKGRCRKAIVEVLAQARGSLLPSEAIEFLRRA